MLTVVNATPIPQIAAEPTSNVLGKVQFMGVVRQVAFVIPMVLLAVTASADHLQVRVDVGVAAPPQSKEK